ncbi:hypothetical protein MSIMFI_05481 [Mycobacterium simulans]|nr:hypothetical protein MSIMFI_05481 [Mycobacterium simulans]
MAQIGVDWGCAQARGKVIRVGGDDGPGGRNLGLGESVTGKSGPVELEQAVAQCGGGRLVRYPIGQGAQDQGGDGDDGGAHGIRGAQGVGVGTRAGEADMQAGGRRGMQADPG